MNPVEEQDEPISQPDPIPKPVPLLAVVGNERRGTPVGGTARVETDRRVDGVRAALDRHAVADEARTLPGSLSGRINPRVPKEPQDPAVAQVDGRRAIPTYPVGVAVKQLIGFSPYRCL